MYVPRLARAGSGGSLVPPAGERAWRLGIERRGTLENLALVPGADAGEPLAADQVRIAVHAAGLDFRDVLIALGMYAGEAPIGSGAAGAAPEGGPGVGH